MLAAFVLLAVAITAQTSKRLRDFDQSFYTTIAYDIERHGVFSSGIFDGTDSTRDVPAPGMFFVPGYPLLILAAMKVDPRFGEAVRCSVEGNHGLRDETTCEDYALPIHLAHAFLLAIAVLAFAMAAELIFGSARVFWLAGALATASFAADGQSVLVHHDRKHDGCALLPCHAVRIAGLADVSDFVTLSSLACSWACSV